MSASMVLLPIISFKNDFFSENSPVIQIGFNERLLQSFHEIFELVLMEKAGYQQICSGLIIYLLSTIISIKKNENFEGKQIEQTIQRACLSIRENIDQNINIQKLARDLNIDYSLFRKMFKVYTGISPGQYHLSLRIRQAKDLLINTDLSIKEISYRLGFESIYYFSRVFKSKTGINPTEYKHGRQRGYNYPYKTTSNQSCIFCRFSLKNRKNSSTNLNTVYLCLKRYNNGNNDQDKTK